MPRRLCRACVRGAGARYTSSTESGREAKLWFYSPAPQHNRPDHERTGQAAGCSTWLNVPFKGVRVYRGSGLILGENFENEVRECRTDYWLTDPLHGDPVRFDTNSRKALPSVLKTFKARIYGTDANYEVPTDINGALSANIKLSAKVSLCIGRWFRLSPPSALFVVNEGHKFEIHLIQRGQQRRRCILSLHSGPEDCLPTKVENSAIRLDDWRASRNAGALFRRQPAGTKMRPETGTPQPGPSKERGPWILASRRRNCSSRTTSRISRRTTKSTSPLKLRNGSNPEGARWKRKSST
jgi:hypothetical protein